MTLTIDRETRLEETLHAVVKQADAYRREAERLNQPFFTENLRRLRDMANEANGFSRDVDPADREAFHRQVFAAVYAARVVQSLTETRDQVARWSWTTAAIAVDEYERLAKERSNGVLPSAPGLDPTRPGVV